MKTSTLLAALQGHAPAFFRKHHEHLVSPSCFRHRGDDDRLFRAREAGPATEPASGSGRWRCPRHPDARNWRARQAHSRQSVPSERLGPCRLEHRCARCLWLPAAWQALLVGMAGHGKHCTQASSPREARNPLPPLLAPPPAGVRPCSAGFGPDGLLPGALPSGRRPRRALPRAGQRRRPTCGSASCRTARYGWRRPRRTPPDLPPAVPVIAPSSCPGGAPGPAAPRRALPAPAVGLHPRYSQIPARPVPTHPAQRYRICREHRDAPCMLIQGVNSRFCQQVGLLGAGAWQPARPACPARRRYPVRPLPSRAAPPCRPHKPPTAPLPLVPLPRPPCPPQCGFFHPLEFFVGNRRSCQDRLDKHAVRRKRAAARKAGGLAAAAEAKAGRQRAASPHTPQLVPPPSPPQELPTPGALAGALRELVWVRITPACGAPKAGTGQAARCTCCWLCGVNVVRGVPSCGQDKAAVCLQHGFLPAGSVLRCHHASPPP